MPRPRLVTGLPSQHRPADRTSPRKRAANGISAFRATRTAPTVVRVIPPSDSAFALAAVPVRVMLPADPLLGTPAQDVNPCVHMVSVPNR
ncbi:hypothetical protein ABZZ74_52110 [Streptomyces sp. NPDC006476]|uniref:hypothetical protein n=1 Tax=Streptomyces sp. NPDC006476 TaxID=3157175 RepID=UPI0033A30B1F